MKKDTCIYLHKRLDTNEVFYVGIGNDYRPYDKNNRSNWWNNIVNKAGYEVDVIEKNLPWKSAALIEIALIDFFGRKDLGKGNLVNMTDGGDGTKGWIPSAETKAKMSKANKGNKKSAEHKAKISAAKEGEKGSNAKLTEEIVIEIIYQCKFHYYWGMMSDLAKQYGVNPDAISAIKSNRKWKHIDRDSVLLKEGGTPTSSKTSSKTSRLTEEIVAEILYQLKFHYYRGMVNDLAKQYGVHKQTISRIKANRNWKHIDRDSILKKGTE